MSLLYRLSNFHQLLWNLSGSLQHSYILHAVKAASSGGFHNLPLAQTVENLSYVGSIVNRTLSHLEERKLDWGISQIGLATELCLWGIFLITVSHRRSHSSLWSTFPIQKCLVCIRMVTDQNKPKKSAHHSSTLSSVPASRFLQWIPFMIVCNL